MKCLKELMCLQLRKTSPQNMTKNLNPPSSETPKILTAPMHLRAPRIGFRVANSQQRDQAPQQLEALNSKSNTHL
jgi:hypothetical protein